MAWLSYKTCWEKGRGPHDTDNEHHLNLSFIIQVFWCKRIQIPGRHFRPMRVAYGAGQMERQDRHERARQPASQMGRHPAKLPVVEKPQGALSPYLGNFPRFEVAWLSRQRNTVTPWGDCLFGDVFMVHLTKQKQGLTHPKLILLVNITQLFSY